MPWKTICCFIIFLSAIYYYISYRLENTHKDVMAIAVMNVAKDRYKTILNRAEKDATGQISSVSPEDLIAYFRNIPEDAPEFPPFVKFDDIMLPFNSINIPSDEILFAIRINTKDVCAVTGAGEVKIIGDKKTDKLLGVHIVGTHATEIIQQARFMVA